MVGAPAPLREQLAALAAGESVERTCAVLFTDVVDSTLTSARVGDAATARLWAAHDSAARALLRSWGGVEIDRSDGMLLLFDAPTDALAWAADYHRALAELDPPMKARAGLHLGPLLIRRNAAGDVAMGAKQFEADGIAKPMAARIMALAQGGQTLLSRAAHEALSTAVQAGLHSHGHWHLKGVPEPVEIFEASGDSAWRPPADGEKAHRVLLKDGVWVAARETPHSLPAQRNRFVGREGAMRELWRHFESAARLVTVTGPGGSGKTRLAIDFGTRARGAFAGGVWFCDLSSARDAAGVAGAVARGLDVALDKGDASSQLPDVIRARGDCLIVLDNCEQVAGEVANAVRAWLDASQGARFIATSRAALGLAGEALLPLDTLEPAEAIELFRSRARDAAPTLVFSAEDEAALAQLVQVLDGLPLAIELAAARVRLMPPRTLLARMSERFRVLAAPGARGERQSTLRATFDWSWDLLSPAERSALAQLSVFEGGFSLADAEAVVDIAMFDDAPWVPDLVQSLLDKSLLRTRRNERFGMLASVREYASEQLGAAGRFEGSGSAAVQAAIRRHAAYFGSAPETLVTDHACTNLENAVAATRNSISQGMPDLAPDALAAAWAALALRGPLAAALALARDVAVMQGLDASAHKTIERVLGGAQHALGKLDDAHAHLSRALQLSVDDGDEAMQARVQVALGDLAIARTQAADAMPLYESAAAIARRTGELAIECEATKGLGNAHYIRAESQPARERYLEAMAIAQRSGAELLLCAIHSNLGNIAMGQGDLAAAQADFEQALELARRCGRGMVEGNTLCNLGWLAHLRGDTARSVEYSQQALAVARHLGNPRLECVVLCNLAIADEAAGRLDDARRRFEAAIAGVRRIGDKRWEGQFVTYLALLHLREERPADAAACLDSGEALLRAASDRMSLGVLMCARAQLHDSLGDNARAAQSLQDAKDIAAELAASADSELGLAIARAGQALGA